MRPIRILLMCIIMLSPACKEKDPIMVNEVTASGLLGMMRLDMQVANTSARDIRAVKGTITCYDIFGTLVFQNEVEINEPIPSAARIAWRHRIDCKLTDTWKIWSKLKKQEELTYKWSSVTIVYQDD